jgi:hypothetical protein
LFKAQALTFRKQLANGVASQFRVGVAVEGRRVCYELPPAGLNPGPETWRACEVSCNGFPIVLENDLINYTGSAKAISSREVETATGDADPNQLRAKHACGLGLDVKPDPSAWEVAHLLPPSVSLCSSARPRKASGVSMQSKDWARSLA